MSGTKKQIGLLFTLALSEIYVSAKVLRGRKGHQGTWIFLELSSRLSYLITRLNLVSGHYGGVAKQKVSTDYSQPRAHLTLRRLVILYYGTFLALVHLYSGES